MIGTIVLGILLVFSVGYALHQTEKLFRMEEERDKLKELLMEQKEKNISKLEDYKNTEGLYTTKRR